MDSKKISSFFYRLLFAIARFNFWLFYRRIHVEGLDNIPLDKPVIFAANHQNALMDALAMLFSTKKEIFFLSRADIFKKSMTAKLLTFLKIMPVYRPRDGAHTLHLNSQVFEKTARMLQSGIPLGIFPEGSHQEKKRLFPLKKGICRIAFEAAEKTDFTIDLTIIPLGIDYSNHQNRGSDLVINIGKPIAVKGYYDLYRENANKAISNLRDDIAEALIPLMIHVQNLDHYDSITIEAATIAKNNLKSRTDLGILNVFNEKQRIVQHLDRLSLQDPDSYKEFVDSNLPINETSSSSAVKIPRNISTRVQLATWSLLLSIFFIPGFLLNLVPYLAIKYLVKKIKDPQFKSSYDYVLSLLAYPIWYIIMLIVAWSTFGFLWAILIVSLAFTSGVITMRTLYHINHLINQK